MGIASAGRRPVQGWIDEYRHQAAFWAGEYGRRLRARAVRSLPPSAYAALVASLEGTIRPRDLNLGTGFPRVTSILTRTHELAPAELLRVAAQPGLLEPDDFWFTPVRVRELRSVLFDVRSSLAFSDGWVVNGTGTGHRWSMDTAFITGATARVRAGATRSVNRPIAALGNVVEHYHFFLEALPAILRVRQVEPETLFVTTQAPIPFARERLAELGIRYLVVPDGTVVAAATVLVCEGYPRDRTHPADLRLVRDTFASAAGHRVGAGAGPWGERVYISRAHGWRSLRDETRVEEFLAAYGFSIVYLEEMSFADQVACLSSARVLVSPHGAGLSKAVFMAPGGALIELATGECWTNAYRRIAAVGGLDYRLVMLDNVSDDEFGSGDGQQAVETLPTVLDEVLARSGPPA